MNCHVIFPFSVVNNPIYVSIFFNRFQVFTKEEDPINPFSPQIVETQSHMDFFSL